MGNVSIMWIIACGLWRVSANSFVNISQQNVNHRPGIPRGPGNPFAPSAPGTPLSPLTPGKPGRPGRPGSPTIPGSPTWRTYFSSLVQNTT